MQHLSRESFCVFLAVDFVAENRVTKVMKMHTNLMSASAVQSAFNQACLIARSNDAILGSGCPATEGSYPHPLAMDRMSADILFD